MDNDSLQINQSRDAITVQIIINPFTSSEFIMEPVFHDIYNLDSKVNWDGLSLISYSQNMRFAVYPRLAEDLSLIVVPTYENGVVVNISPIDITSKPEWSPYGTFIIGEPTFIDESGQLLGYELFEVGLGGAVHQLTSFSEKFDYPLIRNYKWSTNFEDIAFWFTEDSRTIAPVYLSFVNNVDFSLLISCFTSKDIYSNSVPVWSPDGNYVVIKTNDEALMEILAIIDPENYVYHEIRIPTEMYPVGWIGFDPLSK